MDQLYHLFDALMRAIARLGKALGFSRETGIAFDEILYFIVMITLAFSIGYLIRALLLFAAKRAMKHKNILLLQIFWERKMFTRFTRIIPPIIILILAPLAFHAEGKGLLWIERITWIYLIIALLFAENNLLSAFYHLLAENARFKDRPMKGIIQIIQILFAFLGVIIIISILIDKSPTALLTGLGAFAAVLMLIFRDSILGFVSGVMLAQNDMIRKGDWITIPNSDADGIVIDVTLNTVKIQNFDNTIVTVPPYSLISAPFQNWRGMTDSGGRRIKRSFTIDTNTIHFCSAEELQYTATHLPILSNYIQEKLKQQKADKTENTNNPDGLVNGTIETNLGLFRAYMTLYLRHHPHVNQSLILMVRTLAPNDNGLPLEIYCFSSIKEWVSYESIQAEIMEHYTAILPAFGLYAFQNATGRDYLNAALLTANKPVNTLTGLPPDMVHEPYFETLKSQDLPEDGPSEKQAP